MFRKMPWSGFLLLVSLCSVCAADVIRDPTQPLNYRGRQANALELHSILISSSRKVAIINGKSLREGEVVPGRVDVLLTKINPSNVLIKEKGRTRTLELTTMDINK